MAFATSPLYYRVSAAGYGYTSNASTWCPHNLAKRDQSLWNSAYTKNCHSDCANYVSQAILNGKMPTDDTWKKDTYAWQNVNGLKPYFFTTKKYWNESDFTWANAGGFIFGWDDAEAKYLHVYLITGNDLSTRTLSAHTSDRKNYVYKTADDPVFSTYDRMDYFLFNNVTDK